MMHEHDISRRWERVGKQWDIIFQRRAGAVAGDGGTSRDIDDLVPLENDANGPADVGGHTHMHTMGGANSEDLDVSAGTRHGGRPQSPRGHTRSRGEL